MPARSPTRSCERKHGISEATYYRWKSQFGGMDENQLRKLKALESENTELKKEACDLSLDVRGLKAALRKKY